MTLDRTEDLFFEFKNFDEEIRKKFLSLEAPTHSLVKQLLRILREAEVCRESDLTRIEQLLKVLTNISLENVYQNYLSHPIRVTASLTHVLRTGSYDAISLALCHNMIEAGYAEKVAFLSEHLSSEVSKAIDLLTIDRAREHDSEYLQEYYERIENHSQELSLLKALDKLDNILWWPHFKIEPHQVYVVEKYVIPMVRTRYPKIAQYIDELVPYVLLDETKAKFTRLTTLDENEK